MPFKDTKKRKQWFKNHYQDNKEYYIKKSIRNKNVVRDFIKDLKQETPCKDCGKNFPYYVMDFDHLSDKEYNISGMFNTKGFLQIKKEIGKCEIVCSNCHRIRTFTRNEK